MLKHFFLANSSKSHHEYPQALLLKEIGSDKKVYGFDSFTGFPPVFDPKDDFSNFANLFKSGNITKEHYEEHRKLVEIKTFLNPLLPDPSNISTSGSFEDTSYEFVQKKAQALGLDNICLIKGDFADTMNQSSLSTTKFMSVLMDCDIYKSYCSALPFAWDRMISGAFMYIDEYFSLKFPGARIACDEFFLSLNIKPILLSKNDGEFERWGIYKK